MPRAGRILFVITDMARGGAERQVVDLATGLRARGWAVAILTMLPPVDLVAELEAAGVEVANLGMRRGRPTPAALLGYLAFVRRWRPDVVHAHMVHANLLARVGRLLAPRVPVVCTVHSVIEGRRWREVAYRLTDPLASVTTAVSRAATERYVRVGAVPRRRILTLPNGYDVGRAVVPAAAAAAMRGQLVADGEFLWVTVGRLDPEKGHDILLRAFAIVRRERPDARLVIAGEGSERAALERLAARAALDGVVKLLGERADVPVILAAADAFVLSSRWEGLPMVLLEAAAARLPIVCTDVGGCREVARPERGAILSAVSPESLAGGMLQVMGLPAAERGRIGQHLREGVRAEYDMATILDRWEALYGRHIRG